MSEWQTGWKGACGGAHTDPKEAMWAPYKRWYAGQISRPGRPGPPRHPFYAVPACPRIDLSVGAARREDGHRRPHLQRLEGCGGVMRVAPIGALAEPFDLACRAAAAPTATPPGG